MLKLLIIVVSLFALALAGCAQQEVVKVIECVKIVDVKYYQTTFLGVSSVREFYVLANGQEIRTDSKLAYSGRDAFGQICETTYKAKK